jgi:predicted DNA binding protein
MLPAPHRSEVSVLAEFIVPPSEFVLAETLSAAPEMRIEIKRVVGGETLVTPYFWAAGGDFQRFEEALWDDDMVRDVLPLEEQEEHFPEPHEDEDERFYRVTWETGVPNLVSAVAYANATLLEAISGDSDDWEVKVLAPSGEALSTFRDYCLDNDFGIEPLRVYHPENPQEQAEYGVTEDQQEAMEAAYHAGYFEVPREITLADLADEVGISNNALSARLRRGTANLVANTLIHEG